MTALTLANLLGARGPAIADAMAAGLGFLDSQSHAQLRERVGKRVDAIPPFIPIDKRALQDSYGGNQTGPGDDFLVGRGLFYLDEQRRLFLDCTSGHYQMLWGYNHPELCAAIAEAARAGVIWDNHSNIPQAPLKHLAYQLLAAANPPGDPDPLDKVLLGVCTGSVACAAALKIQLKVFRRAHGTEPAPVLVVLDGNYHGTDMVPQFMRGLWPGLTDALEVVRLQPNEGAELEAVFSRHGPRIAGFWAEPVMMNREAIALEPAYLQRAQELCHQAGGLFCMDEIQTGFWRPELFEFRALGLRPDLVVVGKGMTAGFHPLAAVLFRHRHDLLEQYDAISTNGSAALPAWVALCSLELIRRDPARLAAAGTRIGAGFQALAAEFPRQVLRAQGRGHLSGLKFRTVEAARTFHRQLLDAGLWTRVHAYHAGHSTVLTKLGLLADDGTIDFLIQTCRRLLAAQAAGGSVAGADGGDPSCSARHDLSVPT